MNKLINIILLIGGTQIVEAQSFATGLLFDDAAYAKTPVKKITRNLLPSKASLKEHCPTPQQQGAYQNCVGWAIGYAACTISEAVSKQIQDKQKLDAMAISPSYVYTHGKSEKDIACKSGAVIDDALQKLKGVVIPRFQSFGEVCMPLEQLPKNFTEGVRITEFVKLFQNKDDKHQKLHQVKSALANHKPVIVGIACYQSLKTLKRGETVWSGNLDDYQGGHAVCLTGYDDNLEGGVVEMMNSWGTNWGDNGFAMIRYQDLDTILKYAYEIKTEVCTATIASATVATTEIEQVPLTLASSIELKSSSNHSTIALEPMSRGFKPVLDESKPSFVSNVIPANYKTTHAYTAGTKFRVFVDYTEPIYLYVLGSDLTGQVGKVFPANATMSPYLSNPNAQIVLPDEKWSIELDQTKGKDYLIFVYAQTALPIDDLLREWNAQSGSAVDKIHKTFDAKMKKIDTLNLSENQMTFRTSMDSKNIILLTLEMEHQ